MLSLEHRGRVVVSWSVNTVEVARQEESGASSITDRLDAAYKCREAGYKIGFHFDPLIYYPGWEAGYKETVDMIFSKIKPESISWISLGALRFNPELKPVIRRKFPDSKIIYEEMLPALDGKLRYFITIRRQMYRELIKYIRAYSPPAPVYLCMEKNSLAEDVF